MLSMKKPLLDPLPIPLSSNFDVTSVFNYSNFAVSVNYYVLRSQKEKNS